MEISTIVLYIIGGLLMIIGYFLRDKVGNLEDEVKAIDVRLLAHEKEDIAQHNKMFEARIEAQSLYITRTEFNDTITRVFNKLDEIGKDIRNLLTDKADK